MVTGLLVLLGALTAGIEGSMMESATTLMTGDVNVGGFFKVTSGSAAPLVSGYPKVLAATRAAVPELDYYTIRGRGWAKAVSDSASMDLVLGGVDIAHEPAVRRVLQPVAGSLDELAKPNTVLLFQGQAERLKVGVDDVVTLSAPTERGVNNTVDVRVGGGGEERRHHVGLLRLHPGRHAARALRPLPGAPPAPSTSSSRTATSPTWWRPGCGRSSRSRAGGSWSRTRSPTT